MSYSNAELAALAAAAQLIADENTELSVSPKCFQIPPQFYVALNATSVDLPLTISQQACNVYCNVWTAVGTASGKFTGITKFTRMLEWKVGVTTILLNLQLAGTAVEGTYFEVWLTEIQPPRMPVPEYSSVYFRVYFSATRSAGIPLSYFKVWETDLVTTHNDLSLLGYNLTSGEPTWRCEINQERWQFGGDDILFMLPNEIPFGQSNGCGANPWQVTVDPVTLSGTVRALRTEWVPNTANAGASLRVIDGHGNDSSTQLRVPMINSTHRSGLSACTMTTMVFRYGYLEAEVYMNYNGPTWPTAFWLLPIYNDGGSTLNEVDVGENRIPDWQATQTDAGFAYHFNNYGDRRAFKVLNAAQRGITIPGGNTLYGRWIRYGVLWTKDIIQFYIDGVAVATCGNTMFNEFAQVILMHRTFGGTTSAGFGNNMYIKKMELWQSANSLDKQWLWKNEMAPSARAGYRWDSNVNCPQVIALTNAGLVATMQDLGSNYRLHQNCSTRTVGNCSANQKRYACLVLGHDLCVNLHMPGMQMMFGWSGFSQIPHIGYLCRAGQVHGAKAATMATGMDIADEGDTFEIAVDRANNKVWFRVTPVATGTPGYWNNSATDNPATNTGGLSIAGIFPSASLAFLGVELPSGYKGVSCSLVVSTPPAGFSNF